MIVNDDNCDDDEGEEGGREQGGFRIEMGHYWKMGAICIGTTSEHGDTS